MDPGEEDEANRSKRVSVNKRLQSKQSEFVIFLAKQLVEEYEAVEFAKIVEQFSADSLFKFLDTRIFKKGTIFFTYEE